MAEARKQISAGTFGAWLAIQRTKMGASDLSSEEGSMDSAKGSRQMILLQVNKLLTRE